MRRDAANLGHDCGLSRHDAAPLGSGRGAGELDHSVANPAPGYLTLGGYGGGWRASTGVVDQLGGTHNFAMMAFEKLSIYQLKI
jgi:hypothetical protein